VTQFISRFFGRTSLLSLTRTTVRSLSYRVLSVPRSSRSPQSRSTVSARFGVAFRPSHAAACVVLFSAVPVLTLDLECPEIYFLFLPLLFLSHASSRSGTPNIFQVHPFQFRAAAAFVISLRMHTRIARVLAMLLKSIASQSRRPAEWHIGKELLRPHIILDSCDVIACFAPDVFKLAPIPSTGSLLAGQPKPFEQHPCL
jgi:hypothetical protein